jgi:hypothetical protein
MQTLSKNAFLTGIDNDTRNPASQSWRRDLSPRTPGSRLREEIADESCDPAPAKPG